MMTNIVDCDLDKIRIGQPVPAGLQADRRRPAGADVHPGLNHMVAPARREPPNAHVAVGTATDPRPFAKGKLGTTVVDGEEQWTRLKRGWRRGRAISARKNGRCGSISPPVTGWSRISAGTIWC